MVLLSIRYLEQYPFPTILFLLLLLTLWSFLPAKLCFSKAKKLGKPPFRWLLLGLAFGWIAVLLLADDSGKIEAYQRWKRGPW